MTLFSALVLAASLLPMEAIEEFEQYCSQLDDFNSIAERITTAGWQDAAIEPDSPMAGTVAMVRSFRSDQPTSFQYQAYSSPDLVDANLLLMRRSVGSKVTLECELYLPSAKSAPGQEALREWSKREPTRSINDRMMTAWWWEPGLLESHSATGVVFVAQNSPAREMLLGSGLKITGRRETVSN